MDIFKFEKKKKKESKNISWSKGGESLFVFFPFWSFSLFFFCKFWKQILLKSFQKKKRNLLQKIYFCFYKQTN